MIKLKICGIANEDDLTAAVQGGADAIGLQVGQQFGGRYFILPSTAGRLAERTPPYVTAAMVTQMNDVDEIVQLVKTSQISTLQINFFDEGRAGELRDRLPAQCKLVQTLFAADAAAMRYFEKLYPLVDAFNLDIYHSGPETAMSITEGVYRYSAAVDLVKHSLVPVMVGGHLDAAHLPQLLQKVKPYGVDICAGAHDPDGKCSAQKVRELARLVKDAAFGGGAA